MSYNLHNSYPQRGIITTVSGQQAQVFIPLAKYETGFIDSIVHLNPSLEGKEVVVLFINGDRNQGVIVDLVAPSNTVYPQEGTILTINPKIQVSIPSGNVTVNNTYVPLSDPQDIGKTALMLFLDGDIQQPVIMAVKS